MSGIVGSKLNIRGSGRIAKLGTDGQVLTSAGAGQPPAFEAAAGGGTTVKRHWFTEGTRTAGNGTADTNQFTITAAFIPTDPTAGNNDLLVQWNSPINGAAANYQCHGLRFNDGTTDYDFNDEGATNYVHTTNSGFIGGTFNIAAGTIPAGTYSIYVRSYVTEAYPLDYWNINTTDDSRVFAQQHTTLLITEYKN